MKKLILCIIPLILIAMVFAVVPASAESESSTVLVSFDDGNGLACTQGSIAGVTSAVKTQGGGSLHINRKAGANPGIIIFYNFSAKNLASYDYFAIDLWMPVGHNWGKIGINFTTDAGGNDGLNYYQFLRGNTGGGWFTVKMDKGEFANAVNGAKWESITRVRIVWEDYYNNSSMTHILFDNLRGVKRNPSATATKPSINSSGAGTINSCESVDGWTDNLLNTEVGKSDYIKHGGSYSIVAKSKIPVGQSSKIGAMTRLNFASAVDFSKTCKFTFWFYFDQKMAGTHQLQFNFITGSGEDGYNATWTFGEYAANTWHNVSFYKNGKSANFPVTKATSNANWASINAIRITWFNGEQRNIPVTMYIDDISATGHTSQNGGTSGVHTKCKNCTETLSTSHSYSTSVQTAATCTTKGTTKYTCSCGYYYTSQNIAINSSNHTGSSVYGGTSGVHTKYNCCGATISSSHNYNTDSGVKYSSATCTAKQKNYKRCACGYNPQSTSYLVEVGSVNSSNHTGSSTYGGSSGVHTKYTCCGATISSSHTYDRDSGVQYSAATCTAKRKNYKSCVCGYNPKSTSHLVETGSALGHAYNTKDTSSTYLKSAATCTAAAVYYYKCDRCTSKGTNTYSSGNKNSSNHTGSVVNAGTAGVHTKYNCCNATVSTSHSYTVDSGVQYSAATCTAKRKNYKKCSCGYNPQSSSYLIETGSVNSSNHTGSEVNAGTSSAHTKYSCCGATIKGSSSHSYTVDSGVQYSAATCTAKRKNYKKCSCGYNPQSASYVVETGSVNSSNHTGSEVNGGTKDVHTKYSCCGATIKGSSSHSYTVDSGVQYTAATCTAKRKNYKKCSCGYNPQSSSYVVETGSVNSSNHTGSEVNAGTKDVHTKYSCCGATIKGSSSHSYTVDSGVQYTAATCTAKRKNYKKCSCGYNPQSASYVVETGSVNSSNHTGSEVNGGTSEVHTKYSCCGATIKGASSHSYTKTTQTPATCTVKGTSKYTCGCGYSYTSQDIAALGHDFTKKDTSATYLKSEATCTDLAVYYYRCTRCTEKGTSTYTSGSVNASNHTGKIVNAGTASVHTKYDCCNATVSTTHTYTTTVKTPATCTVKGTTTYTCGCGYTYDSQDIPALGHDFTKKDTSATYLKSEATCTDLAVYYYRCSRCTEKGTSTYTSGSVNASNHTGTVVFVGEKDIHSKYDCCNATVSTKHTYTKTVEVPATCTVKGTSRYTCECGYTYTAQDIDIDPANHTGKVVFVGSEAIHSKYDCCNATVSTTHTYDKTVEIAATCTVKGTSRYTCECGYTYTAQDIDIDPNNHVGGTEVRNASIVYSGDTYCLDCNQIVVKGEIIAYYGDVNNDKTVDAVDAMILAQYIIGLDVTVDFNDSTTKTLADVDGDGMLTSIDTMLITQHNVGLITIFPVER